jgi:hypothetical protein
MPKPPSPQGPRPSALIGRAQLPAIVEIVEEIRSLTEARLANDNAETRRLLQQAILVERDDKDNERGRDGLRALLGGVSGDVSRRLDPALPRVMRVALIELWELANSFEGLWQIPSPELDRHILSLDETLAVLYFERGSVLRREEDGWLLVFGEEKQRFGNRKVFPWLARLLGSPHRDMAVAELLVDPEGLLAADARLGGQSEMDDAGTKTIRDRLDDLSELEATTGGLSKKHADERARLLQSVEQYARTKKLKTPVGKAYNNIATQLRTLRKELAGKMPNLRAHLKASIIPDGSDFTFRYSPPAGTPAWKIN